MAGRQLADAFVNRHRGGYVIEREVVTQGVEIKFGRRGRMSENRLWLRGVDQFSVEDAVIKRFFSKAVAGEDQPFPARVPKRDREHSVDVIDECIAVLFIEMRNNFCVSLRSELVATFFKVGADLAIVIQLTILHRDDGAVLTKNRLIAGLQIDNRKPPHP